MANIIVDGNNLGPIIRTAEVPSDLNNVNKNAFYRISTQDTEDGTKLCYYSYYKGSPRLNYVNGIITVKDNLPALADAGINTIYRLYKDNKYSYHALSVDANAWVEIKSGGMEFKAVSELPALSAADPDVIYDYHKVPKPYGVYKLKSEWDFMYDMPSMSADFMHDIYPDVRRHIDHYSVQTGLEPLSTLTNLGIYLGSEYKNEYASSGCYIYVWEEGNGPLFNVVNNEGKPTQYPSVKDDPDHEEGLYRKVGDAWECIDFAERSVAYHRVDVRDENPITRSDLVSGDIYNFYGPDVTSMGDINIGTYAIKTEYELMENPTGLILLDMEDGSTVWTYEYDRDYTYEEIVHFIEVAARSYEGPNPAMSTLARGLLVYCPEDGSSMGGQSPKFKLTIFNGELPDDFNAYNDCSGLYIPDAETDSCAVIPYASPIIVCRNFLPRYPFPHLYNYLYELNSELYYAKGVSGAGVIWEKLGGGGGGGVISMPYSEYSTSQHQADTLYVVDMNS